LKIYRYPVTWSQGLHGVSAWSLCIVCCINAGADLSRSASGTGSQAIPLSLFKLEFVGEA
jgi:hypothetical protein